ncbi:type IV pilin protein [Bilifractor sp. HCP3S3_D3]|uniref:type IV pilin protein n=1 Tax=Bilifractor sp. HCP3S3_D3 TaxID=3438907 RepID=UPI003F891A22
MWTKNKKGFTLAELLIIVAIIAVLVAISIPIFSSQLEKSRKAVDLANVRSAKAAAAAEYMNTDMTESRTYYYDAATGTVMNLQAARGNIKGYGKSHHPFAQDKDGASGRPNTGKASGVVAVTIKADGTQSAEWEFQGWVEVNADNVNDYVVKNEDGTYSLQFKPGRLSYVNIKDGAILKSVKDKNKITSIVFGKNNLFQNEDNPLNNGDTNKGILFERDDKTPLRDYTNLEKIDFSGITIGQIDLLNLSKYGVTKLKEVVLPDQDGLKFYIEGNWYYLDDNNKKVSLKNGNNSRVDTTSNSALKGKTIYRVP